MPSITVYWYSQTGQLLEVLQALLAPVEKAGARVTWVEVAPVTGYPFPWPLGRFFGVFPEAVDPTATVPVTASPAGDEPADLVVVGFQVWYLAPSVPVRALLAGRSFAGHDVLGVVACRNMWYSAALDVRHRLATGGARYLGTVAAVDDAPPLLTFVTTLRWLLRGRREAFWRFPAAGVGAGELDRLRELGVRLAEALAAAEAAGTPPAGVVREVLRSADAAPLLPAIAAADLIAGRAFAAWGRAIRGTRHRPLRAALLTAFVGTLAAAIVVGLPLLGLATALAGARVEAAVRRRLAPALGEYR